MSDTIATILDQISVKGFIRDVEKEEVIRLLEQVRKNDEIILNLQKQLLVIEKGKAKRRRRV